MSGRRSSWSAFGLLIGNNISGHYKPHYFFSSPLSTFLMEGVLGSKTYLVKVDRSDQNLGVDTFPDPFWGPIMAIF